MAHITGITGVQVSNNEGKEYIDTKYQYATTTYGDEHGMKPALIVQPKTKHDISQTIKYANTQNVAVATRTGGHQYSGASSTLAPNIQLDLKMSFRGDDDRQIFEKDGETFVRTGVSYALGEFNKFLGDNGLFVPHGQCTNVHLGGHVQTGGYGQLGRSFGLFGDHVVGLEIVDCEGAIKEVTKQNDPELFSAILGGSPGNLGVITHIIIRVHRDQDYVGSRGLKALYWYSPEVLERLLGILAEMADDEKFPRNYDYCVSVLSEENELLSWFPEVDQRMQRDHPQLYGENGMPLIWPRVIIVYAQWVPFAKTDVPDLAWFERIHQGCLFPLTTRLEEKSMSKLTAQWIFRNIREFEHPYVKSTLMSDSRSLVKGGWAKWCAQRVDAIVGPEDNRCYMSAQFQNFGGKNSMFTRNANNGTSYSWRDSTLCATMDVFYQKEYKSVAEDWHTVTIQEAVGKTGKFSNQERHVLWGSFGDYDLGKVWEQYYDSAEAYGKIQLARAKYDPYGVFTPNSFSVPRK